MALTPQDRLEILDLYARYNHFVDYGDVERWVDLYTNDGSLTGLTREPVCGRENLLALARGRFDKHKADGQGLRHVVTNIALDGTPEGGAIGMAYLAVYTVGGGEPAKMLGSGRYRDEMVRGTDGWRFRTRKLTLDR